MASNKKSEPAAPAQGIDLSGIKSTMRDMSGDISTVEPPAQASGAAAEEIALKYLPATLTGMVAVDHARSKCIAAIHNYVARQSGREVTRVQELRMAARAMCDQWTPENAERLRKAWEAWNK